MNSCANFREFLYTPSRNRGRPRLSEDIRRRIWHEAAYRCARCGRIGVEIHHIIPWREALAIFRDAHYEANLIALCPSCHAAADSQDISVAELEELKRGLQSLESILRFPRNLYPSSHRRRLGTGADLAEIVADYRSEYIYKRRSSAQYSDLLKNLLSYTSLSRELGTQSGIELLFSYANFLRRQSSRDFATAQQFLHQAAHSAQIIGHSGDELGRLFYEQAYISFLQNDFDTAAKLFRRSIAADRAAHRNTTALISEDMLEYTLARIHGHYPVTHMERRLHEFEAAGGYHDSRRRVAQTHYSICDAIVREALWHGGTSSKPPDLDSARDHLIDSQRLFDAIGLASGPGIQRLRGALLLLTGQYEDAALMLSAAMMYHDQMGVVEQVAETLCLYGIALERLGDIPRAKDIYEKARSCDPAMDNRHGIQISTRRLSVLI